MIMKSLIQFVWPVFVLAGCILPEVHSTEVTRTRSPDGSLEGVVIERIVNVTTPYSYWVYVTTPGAPIGPEGRVASAYGAIRNDSAWGMNLRWVGPRDLAIEYLKARRDSLIRANLTIGARSVQIHLRSGITDTSAPGGGMAYNLRKVKG